MIPDPTALDLVPIGRVTSPFTDRFGIPRQAGLIQAATGTVDLFPPYGCPAAVRGLEKVSHIWVLFIFHQGVQPGWQPTVRPPRLGGNRRIGVFASRSPRRPNRVGMSVLRLERIACDRAGVRLHVRGLDLLDGTPVIDVKPYVPYADSVPEAEGDWMDDAPERRLAVRFSPEASAALRQMPGGAAASFEALLGQVLALDPRPAYRGTRPESRSYGMQLAGMNVRWLVEDATAVVTEVHPAGPMPGQERSAGRLADPEP